MDIRLNCDEIWGICEGACVVNLESEDMWLFTCELHSWSVRGTGLCYLYLSFIWFLVLLYVDAAKGSALCESVRPDTLMSSLHLCVYIWVCAYVPLWDTHLALPLTEPESRNSVGHTHGPGMERTLGTQTALVWASADRKEESSVPGAQWTQRIPYNV